MAAFKDQSRIFLVGCVAIFCCLILADGDKIGVDYGMVADKLPSADEVVTLMKSNNIGKTRIYQESKVVLQAFAISGIDVIVGVANDELQAISSSRESANGWVKENIVPFYPATNVKYIAVGNEVLGTSDNLQYVPYLVPAMNNIQTEIQNANLQNSIKVSTTHRMDVSSGNPPSNGVFVDAVKDTMSQILNFLSRNGGPFMADVYPYFSYIGDPSNIHLDYALFLPTATPVTDGDRSYTNLFDAMVDTLLSAMEASGYPNIPIVITESGWPSAGKDVADAATIENAQTYNNNLIKHVLSNAGTPKRPGMSIDTYVFALFNEDLKQGDETEKHFGLFNPDQSPVYPVNFSP